MAGGLRRPASPASLADRLAAEADDPGNVRGALDNAATMARNLWLTFVIFGTYLIITVGSVTHRDLFLENPIRLPLLNVDLPLGGFFVVAPLLLVVFHAYLLLNLKLLADNVERYDELVKSARSVESLDQETAEESHARLLLPNFPFVQLTSGPANGRAGWTGRVLKAIVWITVVLGPIAFLLLTQLVFLPYHEAWITWWHRGLLAIDLVLLWLFWPYIMLSDGRTNWRTRGRLAGLALGLATILFAVLVVTFPGESQNRGALERINTRLFHGDVDEIAGKRTSLWSNTLVLPDQDFVDDRDLDKNDRTLSLRGRGLRGAVLVRTDLRKADLTGADLRGADLSAGRLHGADLTKAQLQGATLVDADLSGVTLNSVDLRGADLSAGRLREANLTKAQLQGATLIGANLGGVALNSTHFEAANLQRAHLEGANAEDPSYFEAANLAGAHFEGATLLTPQFQGATLAKSNFIGAKIRVADFSGATFEDNPHFDATYLPFARLWRTRPLSTTTCELKVEPHVGDRSPSISRGSPEFEPNPGFDDKSLEQTIQHIVSTLPADKTEEARRKLEDLKKGAWTPESEAAAKQMWSDAIPTSSEDAWKNNCHDEFANPDADVRFAKILTDAICRSSNADVILRGLIRQRERLRAQYNGGAILAIATAISDEDICPEGYRLSAEDKRAFRDIANP